MVSKWLIIAVTTLAPFNSAIIGQVLINESRLREEIDRHVLDECDLWLLYGKNRIDFDPLDVAFALPEIINARRKQRDNVKGRILKIVNMQQSFYKRVLIYNIYYRICLSQVSVEDAEDQLMNAIDKPISNKDILKWDRTIRSLYSTQSNSKRIVRDEAKIEILSLIEKTTKDDPIKRKIKSAIQEVRHDIELWRS